MFIVLPCALMFSFQFLHDVIGTEYAPTKHNFDQSKYTKLFHRVPFMGSEMSVRPVNSGEIFNVTLMGGCRVVGRREVGLVVSEEFGKHFTDPIGEALSKLKYIKKHVSKYFSQTVLLLSLSQLSFSITSTLLSLSTLSRLTLSF